MDHKKNMLEGKPYLAMGDQLFDERQHAKRLLYEYNNLFPDEFAQRTEILKKLLGNMGTGVWIEPPFQCDYGYNIEVGEKFYANYHLTILDGAKVKIGDRVLIGPNVGIYTAGHPIHKEIRRLDLEYSFPITIGNDVWIGGNTVINPNVTIGDNVVIGAGSVVTRDIPSNVIAFGNPCKVYRNITEEDKNYYYKDLAFHLEEGTN